jgi:hypothetical protein
MFLAVASSAFLLRIQAVERAYGVSQQARVSAAPVVVPVATQAPLECGYAMYEDLNQDGSISVRFQLCPRPAFSEPAR